jgi:hypothetical protein
MKRLLLIALLATRVTVANMPILENALGFGTSAHAQNMDQGNDNQGDDDPGADMASKRT